MYLWWTCIWQFFFNCKQHYFRGFSPGCFLVIACMNSLERLDTAVWHSCLEMANQIFSKSFHYCLENYVSLDYFFLHFGQYRHILNNGQIAQVVTVLKSHISVDKKSYWLWDFLWTKPSIVRMQICPKFQKTENILRMFSWGARQKMKFNNFDDLNLTEIQN